MAGETRGWGRRLRSAPGGTALGLAIWLLLGKLGVAEVVQRVVPVGTGVALLAGALLGFAGLIILEWVVLGISALTLLLVAWTPLIRAPVRAMIRADLTPSQGVDAVVVLSARMTSEGKIGPEALSRLLTGISLARGGPHTLVVTRLEGRIGRDTISTETDQRALVERFGAGITLHVVGPVGDTHDEAVSVAALASREGWRRVAVVTSPLHTRRACGAFQAVGLVVSCKPSEGRAYSTRLRTAEDRVGAFHDWIYEAVATRVYRRRGWLH